MVFSGQYLTYDEFQVLGGTLDQNAFNLLEYEARKIIDHNTFGRLVGLNNIPEEVKLCEFALIRYCNEANKGNITSESVGSYSVSYADKTIQDNAKNGILRDYLVNVKVDGVPLLYCGV